MASPASPDAAAAATPAAKTSLFGPLAVRDFRLLWFGESVSVVGTQLHFVAMPWLVLQLTGSNLALGTVLTTAAVPRALFMLFGGALTDCFSPRALMLASNLARALIVGGIAALVATGAIRLWQLYLLAFLFGAADAFFYPAYSAMVPRLLPAERLAAGNALLQGTAQAGGLFGPAVGGVLVAAGGLAVAFGVDAATFLVAGLMAALIRGGRRTPEQAAVPEQAVLASVREGIVYAWRDPVLRGFLMVIAVINLAFVGPFVVGTAALANQRFAGGAVALGTMYAALGGGALLGTAAAGAIGAMRRRGLVLFAVILVIAAGTMLLPLAPSAGLAAAIIAPVGAAAGFNSINIITWLQTRTEPHMLGRVMSLVMFNAVGTAPLSYALAGAAADLNLTAMFVAAGALASLSGMLVIGNRELRQFE